MGWITNYDIEFKGLKEGLHKFEYDIKDEFFEHFEQGLVNSGCLKVNIKLERRSTFLRLDFDIKGWISLTCDRCLEKYHQPIAFNDEIYVKFGESKKENGDKIIWILNGEHRLNLVQLIYEFIIVSIPLKHVHPENSNGEPGCNKEMIKKLAEYTNPVKEENKADPRWEVLRKIKNNN